MKIAYIGGGSRGWAWSLMCDLAKEKNFCGEVYLYDTDFQAAKDNEKIGNGIKKTVRDASDWTYKASKDYAEALTGADFVIISVLPGTFDEMQSDVEEPEAYGIYAPVGDTTGLSGTIRALRAVPMFREFAENIKKYCPDAKVINYTNPMTCCVRAMYEVFPDIKAVGCCHEVFGTQRLLAEALKKYTGIEANFTDIDVEVAGINHFTWITKAFYKDIDLFPIYKKFASEYADTGYPPDFRRSGDTPVFDCTHKVKFDLFNRFGVIAAAGDRHLSEFCPGAWYLKNDEHIQSYGFIRTPVQYRKDELKERLARSRRLVSGEEPFKLYETGEAGTRIMEALSGVCEYKTNVNYPNKGQFPQAPLGAVVETNVFLSGKGVSPIISATPLPLAVYALIDRVIKVQEMTVKAAVNYDLKLAFDAFVMDQTNILDLKQSRKLFDTMIKNTRKYLPDEYFA